MEIGFTPNYEDMRVGDIIECFRVEMVTRTL